MQTSLLSKRVAEKIRDNADILAMCRDKFGKNHTVQLDVTGKETKRQNDVPLFSVVSEGKGYGEENEDRTFDLQVGCLIASTDTEIVNTVKGVTMVEHEGLAILEDLLDYIMNDLRSISTELTFSEKGQTYDPVEFAPLFLGTLHIGVSYPVLMGGYEPTL